MAAVSLAHFFAAYYCCTDKAHKAALEAWLFDHYQRKRSYRTTLPLPAPPQPQTFKAGKISLDHFFNVVCHESRWRWDHDLLRNAIIHLVTASPQLPRLRRAAKAWQPSTILHRQFKRLMLAENLPPLAEYQITPEVITLMRALQDWLRTNWYRKGEIPRSSYIRRHRG